MIKHHLWRDHFVSRVRLSRYQTLIPPGNLIDRDMPVTCELDREVLNEDTLSSMNDLGLSVFAKLCGFNRGAFVLDPPDGKTYG